MVISMDENRVAVISIIVEEEEAAPALNAVIHEYSSHVVSRMGTTLRKTRGINVICLVVDAPNDIISAFSGKIGRVKGVSVKTAYSNVKSKDGENAG